ncbi:unnamed protein product [Prunus brigantina]
MAKKGSPKLNIAIIHPDLGIVGAERLIVDAAVELASHGHKVHVFTAHHDKNRCFEETISGVPFLYFTFIFEMIVFVKMWWGLLRVGMSTVQ